MARKKRHWSQTKQVPGMTIAEALARWNLDWKVEPRPLRELSARSSMKGPALRVYPLVRNDEVFENTLKNAIKPKARCKRGSK